MNSDRVKAMIRKKADEITADVIGMRRHFHRVPELSGQEKETSRFVAEKLGLLGLDVQPNIGGYGVVGILKGAKPGKTIAWRADMDACAMQEENDVPYKSQKDGIMHVCGHDAHTAVALGIAEVLSSVRDDLCGSIKFIFQPYEEGCVGAKRMMEEGALENPRPNAIYGLHQGSLGPDQSYMEAGQISIHFGTALFGLDEVCITAKVEKPKFNGWAEQELLANKLSQINNLKNRNARRAIHDLVDFKILNKSANDETGEIKILASFRYAMQQYRDDIRRELARIIKEDYVKQSKKDVVIKYTRSVPPVYNEEQACREAEEILRSLIGENVLSIVEEVPPHGTDDFSCFQNALGGLFFFLGSANLDKGIKAWNHSPTFMLEEDCLGFGTKIFSLFLYELLQRRKEQIFPVL